MVVLLDLKNCPIIRTPDGSENNQDPDQNNGKGQKDSPN